MSAGGGGVNPGRGGVNYLEGVVRNFAQQMCAGTRQMSAGGGGVNLERGGVNYLEGGVRGSAHQMCAGARRKCLDGGVVSPGRPVVNFLEGVVIQFARRKCPEATRGWSDEGRRAGQYFTPRALIRVMVACVRPDPMKVIADPACGTGGFFLAAYDFIANEKNYSLTKEQKEFLKHKTFFGNEIVAATRRMALMNLFLHNIGDFESDNFISGADALVADTGRRVDYVLANPPFGKKSSMTITNEEGEQEKEDLTYNRQDFWVTTSNKQLNFVQHIRTILKSDGRAAVVVPDNVLFEGGAGEKVRKKLMETTNLHTILRLPTGVFYKQGVKANVLFFDNKPAAKDPWTKEVWIYDFRTNIHFTLKKNPLRVEDLNEFIECYSPLNIQKRKPNWHQEKNPEGRWRKFTYDEIIARDKTSLDITWIKDKSLTDLDNLPDPDVLAGEIIENLEAGVESFREIYNNIK
jgi:type I restriction enzyme M protein